MKRTAKPTLVDQIETIYAGDRCQGVWLRDAVMSVYVRVSRRSNLSADMCIDIANVCVRNPKLMGKGHFTEFLRQVELIGAPVFIENVLEPRFAGFFHRRGYIMVSNGLTPCFYSRLLTPANS